MTWCTIQPRATVPAREILTDALCQCAVYCILMPLRLLGIEETRTTFAPCTCLSSHTHICYLKRATDCINESTLVWFCFLSFSMHPSIIWCNWGSYCCLAVRQRQWLCPTPWRIEKHGRCNCGLFLFLPHSLIKLLPPPPPPMRGETHLIGEIEKRLWVHVPQPLLDLDLGTTYHQDPTALLMHLELT